MADINTSPLASLANDASYLNASVGRDVAMNAAASSAGKGLSALATGGIGAGIQFGSELLGGLINQMFAKRNAKIQLKNQQKLMDYQNQLQRDMLLDEAALKVQGYKKAGLSTATLGGQFGGNVAVPGGSAGMPSTPQVNMNPLANMANMIGLRRMVAEVKNIEADTELKRSNAGLTNTENYLNVKYGDALRQGEVSNYSANVKKLIAEHDKYVQDIINSKEITRATVDNLDQQTYNLMRTLPSSLQLIAAQALAKRAEAANSASSAVLNRKYIEKVATEIEEIKSRIPLNVANKEMLVELAGVYAEQIINLRKQGRILEADAKVAEYEAEIKTSMPTWYHVSKMVLNDCLDVAERATDIGTTIASRGLSQIGRKTETTTTDSRGRTSTSTSYTMPWNP